MSENVGNSRTRRGSGQSNKRPKLDVVPQVNPNPDPNQIELKWKVPEFVKSTNSSNEPIFASQSIKFKGLLWYVEITGNNEKKKVKNVEANALMRCKLIAENDAGQTLNFVGRLTVTTAYHNKVLGEFHLKEPRKTKFTAYCSSTNLQDDEECNMLTWYESEFPNESCSDEDYMSIKIDYLNEYMTLQDAKFIQMQHTLLDQMKKEVKGMDLLIKWANAESGSGDGDGFTLKEDFVIESRKGIEIGFNKALLMVRGGDSDRSFFKKMLSSGMKESRTSNVKLENFDTETILGFKEYLYHGTIPDLKTKAVEYFKFGDYCELAQIKQLAELEICKSIGDKQTAIQFVEIAQRHETTYLKKHILTTLKKDPETVGKIMLKNFDVIDFSEC